MSEPIIVSPIQVGQRISAMLTSGKRSTTYKLATLMALIDFSLEHVPDDTQSAVSIPIVDLADRVIEYYWPQVRPYPFQTDFHGVLRQGNGKSEAILKDVERLRASAGMSAVVSPAAAKSLLPEYEKYQKKIAHTLAKMPLSHLQTPESAGQIKDSFLFEDDWLHQDITLSALQIHNWEIVLRPGIAWALAQVSTLLRPAIEMQWLDDIAKFNKATLERDNLAGFLFGTTRSNIVKLSADLLELQGGRCFYCDATVAQRIAHVDHVIPFSRIPLDGLSNLVVADSGCNLNKSASLPIREHIDRSLGRSYLDLEQIESRHKWPQLRERTSSAANGIYAVMAPGTWLWVSKGKYMLST